MEGLSELLYVGIRLRLLTLVLLFAEMGFVLLIWM